MIIGLFLDGWAHGVSKPETFFSPWHGILYSGFVGAVVWFLWDARRQQQGTGGMSDRPATAGLVLFIIGAIGDGAWHQVFGIEVDIAALLSPTHLALMIGGALMVTAPLRHGTTWLPERPSVSEFLPVLGSITLVTSLFLFFLMYLSASGPVGIQTHELVQEWGIASILIRSAITMGSAMIVLRRWTPPIGTFTVLFTVPAIALAGLEGFEAIQLAAPFVIGGMLGDAIVALTVDPARRIRVFSIAVPLVTWLAYFGVTTLVWEVRWPAELWTGTVVFAVLTGVGLRVLSDRPAVPARARY
jgi:hypothetical protein